MRKSETHWHLSMGIPFNICINLVVGKIQSTIPKAWPKVCETLSWESTSWENFKSGFQLLGLGVKGWMY